MNASTRNAGAMKIDTQRRGGDPVVEASVPGWQVKGILIAAVLAGPLLAAFILLFVFNVIALGGMIMGLVAVSMVETGVIIASVLLGAPRAARFVVTADALVVKPLGQSGAEPRLTSHAPAMTCPLTEIDDVAVAGVTTPQGGERDAMVIATTRGDRFGYFPGRPRDELESLAAAVNAAIVERTAPA